MGPTMSAAAAAAQVPQPQSQAPLARGSVGSAGLAAASIAAIASRGANDDAAPVAVTEVNELGEYADYVVVSVPADASCLLHAFSLGFFTQKLAGLLSAVPAGVMNANDVEAAALELFRDEVTGEPGGSTDAAFAQASRTARRVIRDRWRADLDAYRASLQGDVHAVLRACVASDGRVELAPAIPLGVLPDGALALAIREFLAPLAARGDLLPAPAQLPLDLVAAYADELGANPQLWAPASALAAIARHTGTRVDRHHYTAHGVFAGATTAVTGAITGAGSANRVDLFEHESSAHVALMLGPLAPGWLER